MSSTFFKFRKTERLVAPGRNEDWQQVSRRDAGVYTALRGILITEQPKTALTILQEAQEQSDAAMSWEVPGGRMMVDRVAIHRTLKLLKILPKAIGEMSLYCRLSGLRIGLLATLAVLSLASASHAAEPPYFVTYSSTLEEPGNLEIGEKGLVATPGDKHAFNSATLELEYGATAYWTTEVYLAGQARNRDSAIFTGFRWENRFRPLPRDHFINPVLYIEYEDINGGDRSLLEIVGHDTLADLQASNAEARAEAKHEVEGKMILSSDFKGWNVSENFIAEKNLINSPWEFGYALAVSRPLALAASAHNCAICRQNFTAGAELYGGLGDRYSFGLHETSHYAGPTVQFKLPRGPTIGFSPQFGLNDNSVGTFWRFKISYEVQQFRDLFRGKAAQ